MTDMAHALSIPRSGSICSDEPDYDPLIARLSARFDVLVDGQVVPRAIAYNVEEGWVRSIFHDKWGKHVIKRGCFTERLTYGNVTVRWRDQADA